MKTGQVCPEAGAWMGWPLGAQPYLLLQVVNLRAQPLYHPVQLRDLHLGGAEVVPVPAGRPLQLLVLGAGEAGGRDGQARGEKAVNSQGPTGFRGAARGHFLLPPALSITPSLYHLLALPFILHVCRLHPTAGPFLYPALQASSPAPDFSLPQTQHPAELPVTL